MGLVYIEYEIAAVPKTARNKTAGMEGLASAYDWFMSTLVCRLYCPDRILLRSEFIRVAI